MGVPRALVDVTLMPPAGAYLRLPGTTADDARSLAAKMSWVSLDRGFDGSVEPPRYRPRLTVRFPEGAPRGVPVPVSTRLLRDLEVHHLRQVIEETRGNKSRAARILGLSRWALQRKLRKHGITLEGAIEEETSPPEGES